VNLTVVSRWFGYLAGPMLIAATRYALTKERWWVIPNLVGLQVGLYYDVLRYIVPDAEILA
jgi:hypothetical protein